MSYSVELTRSAVADLSDIVDWIARNDSQELRDIGVEQYREIFFKPYRIVYHVRAERVIVNMIADGRRDMLALLQRRLTTGK